jgi:hypothetical protein
MIRAKASLGILVVTLAAAITFERLGQGQLFNIAGDRGGDFLKILLALPGPPVLEGPYQELIDKYLESRDFKGRMDVFHLPPFSMLAALLFRWTFAVLSPVIVYLGCLFTALSALSIIVYKRTGNLAWVLSALLSYPLLTAVDRGNLFAALSNICLIAALLRKRCDWQGAVLFAIAINVRPNVVICALPLLMTRIVWTYRLALATIGILLASFAAVSVLFPGYDLESVRMGLHKYFVVYVAEGRGVPFGSSVYGAFFALGHPAQYVPATLIAWAGLPVAIFAFWKGRLRYDEFVFLCAAVTSMGSAIFADYHLLVFLAPLILAKDNRVAIPSVLLLAPKAFWMIDSFSVQVVLNPAIMFIGSWLIIMSALRRRDEPRGALSSQKGGYED